jgi:hypothetical protein
MRILVICGPVALLLAAPAAGNAPCPANSQALYPWAVSGVMPGDRYAEMYLDIDKSGKPINCRMGKNNIPGDDKFFVCKAFIEQWSTSPRPDDPAVGPPPPNLPRGSPIKATVHRTLMVTGDQHAKAEREARDRFFREHPEEQPECYPTGDEQ